MFPRIVKVKNNKGGYEEYVKIVKSYRENGKVKQEIIGNLGNVKNLKSTMPQLINGLLRIIGEKKLVDPQTGKDCKAKEYGVRYVLEELWKMMGFSEVYKAVEGKQAKANEEYIRMMVANKLSDPKSKLGIFRWLRGVWWQGNSFIKESYDESIAPVKQKELAKKEVMKFYRAMDFLIEKKEEIEKHIYYKTRDLFNLEIDLVFYDLTSSYFEGEGPEGLAELGYSRDHEPGKPQVVVGVIICNGIPIGHEVFEGNRVDKKTVKDVLKKIKEQYKIAKCIFVGDRGLISEENLDALENDYEFDSILALKKRRNGEVKRILIKEEPLIFRCEAKDLEWAEVAGKPDIRYIVVRNPEMAKRQKTSREEDIKEIKKQLDALQEKVNKQKTISIKNTTKKVVGILSHHHGKRYFDYSFNETDKKFKYWIKEDAVKLENALDGVYILRTREKKLTPLEIIKNYKDLMDVEQSFRMMKDVLDLRPFYHRKDNRVKAHVHICFLALFFSKIMERCLKQNNAYLSAPMAWDSLKNIQVVEINFNGDKCRYLTELSYHHRLILNSLKIKHPERIKILAN